MTHTLDTISDKLPLRGEEFYLRVRSSVGQVATGGEAADDTERAILRDPKGGTIFDEALRVRLPEGMSALEFERADLQNLI